MSFGTAVDPYYHCQLFHSRQKVLQADVSWLDPWQLFCTLLTRLSYDHLVLLDLIFSPETVFLQYFLSVLHHLLADWQRITVKILLDDDLNASAETNSDNTRYCISG